MKRQGSFRVAVALLMSTAFMLSGVSTAATKTLTFQSPPPMQPPLNDNLANATLISALPFNDSVDNTWATTEPDEPQYCNYSPNTVWYSFTPATDGVFRANMEGSYWETVLSVYWAEAPGFGGLRYIVCASGGSSTVTFVAQAGVTYYFQAGNVAGPYSGALQFHLWQVPPPPNDNWTNAILIKTLPHDYDVDAVAATVESGEPRPTCAWDTLSRSVWYSFKPSTTGSISARVSVPGVPVIAAYTGTSLSELTQVACRSGWGPMTFRAQAGTTYYLQVADLWSNTGWWNLHVEVTPPPIANFYFWPSDPSAFDTVEFRDNSYDPGEVGIQTWLWNLGDGATATDCCPSHKYARDGDYTVNLTVTTTDGRTASTSQVVQVKSHDVAIVRLGAPQSASAGQTRHVYVDIKSSRYPENVRVELYKSVPNGLQFVGMLTNFVPVRPSNRTTQFDFSYTFTADDARMGKVTFKAVATIVDARDALPADNEAISSPTKVGR